MFPPGCRAIDPDLKSTSGVIVNYNTSSQASFFLEKACSRRATTGCAWSRELPLFQLLGRWDVSDEIGGIEDLQVETHRTFGLLFPAAAPVGLTLAGVIRCAGRRRFVDSISRR
jgi:hypothetical protein